MLRYLRGGADFLLELMNHSAGDGSSSSRPRNLHRHQLHAASLGDYSAAVSTIPIIMIRRLQRRCDVLQHNIKWIDFVDYELKLIIAGGTNLFMIHDIDPSRLVPRLFLRKIVGVEWANIILLWRMEA